MHNAPECRFPDIVSEILAAKIRADAAENAAESAENHNENHADAGARHDADIGDTAVAETENTLIDDLCHQTRLPQIDIDLQYHKYGSEQRKMPVFFEMPEYQTKNSFLFQTVYYTIIHVLFCDCKKENEKILKKLFCDSGIKTVQNRKI